MQKPFTFEEFLRSQDLVMWPSCISLDEPYSLVDKLQKDYSFNAICKYLYEHVPLNVSPLSDLEKRINTCITELEKHAEKIFSLRCGPAYLEEHLTALEQSNRQTLAQISVYSFSSVCKCEVSSL
ncbi:LOW QUALITY PROTEIN: protein FAM227B [Aptenodytes patagonicus]|uniref:LOW QUALITY PROTEIN: protein FAM227B n=1 Tax=Aptenodytes patagonicus TaxID=9234 RepID=UPI003F9F4DB9